MKSFILALTIASLSTTSVFASSKDDNNIVELKELRVNAAIFCGGQEGKIALVHSSIKNIQASPYENSTPEEYSFVLDPIRNYDYKDGKTLREVPNKGPQIKLGNLDPSIQEIEDSLTPEEKETCKKTNYLYRPLTIKLDRQYKMLVNVKEIKDKCETDSVIFSPKFEGKTVTSVNIIVVNKTTGAVADTIKLSKATEEVCHSGTATAKGAASVLGTIIAAPLAAIGGLVVLIMGPS